MRIRTLNEAAEALGTTRHRLRRGIDAGRYPVMRWGQRLLVDLDVIEPIVRAEDAEAEARVGIGEISRMTACRRRPSAGCARTGFSPMSRTSRADTSSAPARCWRRSSR